MNTNLHTHRRRTAALLLVAAVVMTSSPSATATQSWAPVRPEVIRSSDNVVLRWNAAALQGVRDSKLGPPMVARALAIMHTCMYDAWSAYDRTAVGTRLGDELRRPRRERTLPNIVEAVSFAAYRAAVDLFPDDRDSVFDPLMATLGYDPADTTTDVSTPAGVGNRACAAVLDFRHHDGANQLGDEPGGAEGVHYSDYTGYQPVNEPMDLTAPFDPEGVEDPARWQPLRYADANGVMVEPSFVGAHWSEVVPFALPTSSALRSPIGPATPSSRRFRTQARKLVAISAGLTDRQKTIAEYWADGPNSELPPGHWNLFAAHVSHRDDHGSSKQGIERDIKLFFALNNALFDAGIVAWDAKRAFDSARPITTIRYLFRGRMVRAWAGPYKGTRLIDGAAWHPYQPSWFPTPPFPEYASGHSNFSAAGAEVLRLFTGSDRFGASVRIPAGSSNVEPGAVPARDVMLSWPTFTAAANQAGISRRYGGIHFTQGDLDARETGRLCGENAWQLAQRYFDGTA